MYIHKYTQMVCLTFFRILVLRLIYIIACSNVSLPQNGEEHSFKWLFVYSLMDV